MTEEGQILTEAEAILNNGKVLYKDIDCFVSPGVWYLTALLFKVFGVGLNLTRLVMAILFSLTVVLVYLISSTSMTKRYAVFAASMMFIQKALVFPLGIFINYTEFAVLFGLLTVYLLLLYVTKKYRYILCLSGISLGLSIIFKQNIGFVLFLGSLVFLFVYYRTLREILTFILPTGLILGLTLLYFVSNGATKDLLHGLFSMPFNGFYQECKVPYLPIHSLWRFTPIEVFQYFPSLFWVEYVFYYKPYVSQYLIPLVKAIVVFLYFLPIYLCVVFGLRVLKKHKIARVEFLLFTGSIAIFTTTFPRSDFVHLMEGIPGWLILGAYIMYTSKYCKLVSLNIFPFILIAGFSILLIIKMPCSQLLVLPRCKVYLIPHHYDAITKTMDWMEKNIPHNESVVVIPSDAMYYFLSDRTPPFRYTVLFPTNISYDKGKRASEMIEDLKVKYIVYNPCQIPGIPPFEKYGSILYGYLSDNYTKACSFSNEFGEYLQILKRNDGFIYPQF